MTSIESLQKDISSLKKDMAYIKNILSENFELSDFAKKELEEARKTPKSEYAEL